MANSEKAQELHDEMVEQIKAMTSSEDWQRWLAVASKFHRYSFFNTLLILSQCPDATRVMGYGAKDGSTGWLSLGRQVRKGEKAIKIFAPIIVKRAPENRAEVDYEKGETKKAIVGFRLVSVFDISQTDGEPLPPEPVTVDLLQGDAPTHVFDAVVRLIEDEGFTFNGDKPMGEANGVTIMDTKQVWLAPGLSDAHRLKTLVHEYAHVLLHKPGQVEYGANRGRCEVEAESVAYIVCTALGIESNEYSFGYVAGWSGGNHEVVIATGQTVVKTAKAVLDKVEERLAALVAA